MPYFRSEGGRGGMQQKKAAEFGENRSDPQIISTKSKGVIKILRGTLSSRKHLEYPPKRPDVSSGLEGESVKKRERGIRGRGAIQRKGGPYRMKCPWAVLGKFREKVRREVVLGEKESKGTSGD